MKARVTTMTQQISVTVRLFSIDQNRAGVEKKLT